MNLIYENKYNLKLKKERARKSLNKPQTPDG